MIQIKIFQFQINLNLSSVITVNYFFFLKFVLTFYVNEDIQKISSTRIIVHYGQVGKFYHSNYLPKMSKAINEAWNL